MSTATDIGTLVTHSSEKDRPIITETSTSVRRVVVLYKQGANAEEIARRLSQLSLTIMAIGMKLKMTWQKRKQNIGNWRNSITRTVKSW